MANRQASQHPRRRVAAADAAGETAAVSPYDPTVDVAVLRHAGLTDTAILPLLDGARMANVSVASVAIARGALTGAAYADAVARALAISRFDGRLGSNRPGDAPGQYRSATGALIMVAEADTVAALQGYQRAHGSANLCLATRAELLAARQVHEGRRALRAARTHLQRSRPDLSAATPLPVWQKLLAVIVPGIVAGGLAVDAAQTVAVLFALLSLPFLAVVAVRLVGLIEVMRRPVRIEPPRLPDGALPTYAVLVPLYGEAALVPDVVRAFQRLDYPAAKLECFLLLEANDTATRAAAARAAKPPNLHIVVAPDGQPRTKPRALAYAMQFVTADVVVVFDAEDRPEPDQLRRAAAALAAGPPNLACVQAQLNLYNAGDSWFTRQFTIEYSALFDAILPALDRLGLPVPLGGTSNHFPRRILEASGGWDPFNVTEDADLGLRLARLGYSTQVLPSTTWEEAPIAFRQWLPQRTRWLKGWVQTALVHTRSPRRLLRDLGLWRTLGLSIVVWGLLLSALVHPLPYLLVGLWAAGLIPSPLPGTEAPVTTWIAFGSLGLGYVTAIAVGWIAVRRRHPALAWASLAMPLTWLLVSFAAYRALWQFVRAPFLWEKTTHAWRRARPQFRHAANAANVSKTGEQTPT